MSKKTLWTLAGVPVLLVLCSCTKTVETDKVTAEATPPGVAQTDSKTERASPKLNALPTEETQLVTRWNTVAGNDAVNLRGFGPVDFRWHGFDKFPHPTYKGGSDVAYAKFRAVLVAFFQHGDNFDYLTTNRLFTVELRHIFEGGHVGTKTTLAKLAREMSQPGDRPDDETRKALRGFSERIEAKLK